MATGTVKPITATLKPIKARATKAPSLGRTIGMPPRMAAAGETHVMRILPRVWGHYSVEGKLKPGALFQTTLQSIKGIVKAAAKAKTGEQFVGMLAEGAAKSIIATFEKELKRRTIQAYQEGFRKGVAEGIARERAAQAAAAKALETGKAVTTIFPKVRHEIAKADYAEAERLANDLMDQYGMKAANVEPDTEDIPMQGVTSISGWVQGAGLHKGQLAVQFKGSKKTGGPVVCIYPQAGRAALEALLAASSSGKWIWRNVYHAPYMFG